MPKRNRAGEFLRWGCRGLAAVLAVLLISGIAVSQVTDPATQLKEVGVTDKRGAQVNLDTVFTNERGEQVALRSVLLPGRPAILVPAYYDCPRLCGLLMNGVVALLNELTLRIGSDFSVITLSFDPLDTVERAQAHASGFRKRLTGKAADGADNWHFLLGTEPNIQAVLDSIGFHVKREGEEYSHTSAIFLLTAEGVVSQYFAGISFPANDVRYGLIEASQGAIGSALDQAFLYCFDYDHLAGKYVWAAFGMLRVGGIITLSLLALLIYRLYRSERQKRSVPRLDARA